MRRMPVGVEVCVAFSEDFATGVVMGVVTDITYSEPLVHSPAHGTAVIENPLYEGVGRTIAALVPGNGGVNRIADRHRRHHFETQSNVPPQDRKGAIRALLDNALGSNSPATDPENCLPVPGLDKAQDPLYKWNGDKASFRNNPWLERFTTENAVQHVAPYMGVIYGLGRLNRSLGRTHPFLRAGAMATGFATGLYFSTARQGYFEARAGVTNGQINLDNLPPYGRKYVAGHQEHHDNPSDPMLGLGPVHRAGFRALERLGIISRQQ